MERTINITLKGLAGFILSAVSASILSASIYSETYDLLALSSLILCVALLLDALKRVAPKCHGKVRATH